MYTISKRTDPLQTYDEVCDEYKSLRIHCGDCRKKEPVCGSGQPRDLPAHIIFLFKQYGTEFKTDTFHPAKKNLSRPRLDRSIWKPAGK